MESDDLPTFGQCLYAFIRAFHLECEDSNLRGDGVYQHILRGQRLVKEERLRELVQAFARALLKSKLFPELTQMLNQPPRIQSLEALQRCLGEADKFPIHEGGTHEERLTARLLYLRDLFERFLGEAHSQEAIRLAWPPGLALVLWSFFSIHTGIALGSFVRITGERFCVDEPSCWTWCCEGPATTPLQELARRLPSVSLGQNPAEPILLSRVINALIGEWDGGTNSVAPQHGVEKTISNLWHGGPDHPDLGTMIKAVELLIKPLSEGTIVIAGFDASAETIRFRRWHGLRKLAQAAADDLGWDRATYIAWCVRTTAMTYAESFREPPLSVTDLNRFLMSSFWCGWHTSVARWWLGVRSAPDAIHQVPESQREWHAIEPPIIEHFRAIAANSEHVRLQRCIQAVISPSTSCSAEDCLKLLWQSLGTWPAGRTAQATTDDNHKLIEHVRGAEEALNFGDFKMLEEHSREVTRLRPSFVPNWIRLAQALTMQGKWSEALAVLQEARQIHRDDPSLRSLLITILLDRGSQTESAGDFDLIITHLQEMPADKRTQDECLTLGDSFVALGRWRDAFDAYARVIKIDAMCAEAYAMGCLCARRAGENRKATEWEKKAHQLGQMELMSALQHFEAQGILGNERTPPKAIQYRILWRDIIKSNEWD